METNKQSCVHQSDIQIQRQFKFPLPCLSTFLLATLLLPTPPPCLLKSRLVTLSLAFIPPAIIYFGTSAKLSPRGILKSFFVDIPFFCTSFFYRIPCTRWVVPWGRHDTAAVNIYVFLNATIYYIYYSKLWENYFYCIFALAHYRVSDFLPPHSPSAQLAALVNFIFWHHD